MEAGHRRGHRHSVPADRHGGGHHPAVRLQAERAAPRNPREGRKADQPRQQEGPDLHRLFGHGGIPVRARERHGENAAGTQHGPHHGGGRRQDDDSGVQGRDEPRPDLLLPEVQGQGRAVPQGHGGHRHPDRDGLHLRGAEPAGLRLLHQLRHPLEPRAHHPALRTNRPHRQPQRGDPARQLLARPRLGRIYPAQVTRRGKDAYLRHDLDGRRRS